MNMVRNNAQVSRNKTQKNIPHTITPPPPACTVVTRLDGSMFSFCLCQVYHLNVSTEIENHQTRQHFSSLQLSNFGELLQFSLFFICSGDEWYPVGSSAAVVVPHPPQDCACCGFPNALLHTSVVTSGYFSQSCSSISLNQSTHSPLTSSINNKMATKTICGNHLHET